MSWRTGTAGPSGSSAVCWVVWSPDQFCLQYVNYLHIQFYKLFQRWISIMLLSKLPSYPLQDEAHLQVFRAFFSPFFWFSFSPFFLLTAQTSCKQARKDLSIYLFFCLKLLHQRKLESFLNWRVFEEKMETPKPDIVTFLFIHCTYTCTCFCVAPEHYTWLLLFSENWQLTSCCSRGKWKFRPPTRSLFLISEKLTMP